MGVASQAAWPVMLLGPVTTVWSIPNRWRSAEGKPYSELCLYLVGLVDLPNECSLPLGCRRKALPTLCPSAVSRGISIG